ncbi:MAG: hypothetical protein Q8Q38_01585 [bacterium]|nr:hypothetical protein [bacterium]
MYSQYYNLKARATALREKGKTYGEIRKVLGKPISKSTLSYWCRNTPLPSHYEERIAKIVGQASSRGRKTALALNRIRFEERIEEIRSRAHQLSSFFKDERTAKVALAMLYLGEGAKWKRHRGLHLGSSDPDIVQIYIRLLDRCYGIPREKLSARISYRVDQDIQALTRFWSRVTGIPKSRFYKTKPDSRTKGKKTLIKDYKGVCSITCAGTDVQLELDFIARMFLED